VSAQKITETIKALKIGYICNINRIRFKIVRRGTKMVHQQQVSCSGSRVTECVVGELSPPLAFVLIAEGRHFQHMQ